MPDPASTNQRTLALRWVDLEHGMARFYMLNVERDLFGTVRLVRSWGRINTLGRELADFHETEDAVAEALGSLAGVKGRLGYRDL